MSDIKEITNNHESVSTLFDEFEDDDFDAMWDGTIGDSSQPGEAIVMTGGESDLGLSSLSAFNFDNLTSKDDDSTPAPASAFDEFKSLADSVDDAMPSQSTVTTKEFEIDGKTPEITPDDVHIASDGAQTKAEDAETRNGDDSDHRATQAKAADIAAAIKEIISDAPAASEKRDAGDHAAACDENTETHTADDKKDAVESESDTETLEITVSADMLSQLIAASSGESAEEEKTDNAPTDEIEIDIDTKDIDDSRSSGDDKKQDNAAAGDSEENKKSPDGGSEEKEQAHSKESQDAINAILHEDEEDRSEDNAEEAAAEDAGDAPDSENIIPQAESECLQLTERQRMGQFHTENEVVVADTAIGKDVIYDEECCEASPAPKSNAVKNILVAAIILLVIAMIAGVFLVIQKSSGKHAEMAQNFVFQIGNTTYHRYYVTDNGRYRAACSGDRGSVFNEHNALIADFWPGIGGCADLKIAEDGKKLWFVDNSNTLFEINLEKEQGFNPKAVARLEGYVNAGFDITNGRARWFAYDQMTPVIRTGKIGTDAIESIPLPQGAIACSGIRNGNYAYISGNAIHMIKDGKDIAASLEAPKLGCPSEFAIYCVYDGDENWSVLCANSIHQGTGSSSSTPVHYKNTGIRSGAHHFNLIRHKDGTELITPKEWLSIDTRGTDKTIEFKERLHGNFDFAYLSNSKKPLRGIVNGQISEISADGQVIRTQGHNNLDVLDSIFVSDGSAAATFFNNTETQKARVILWDIHTGRPISELSFKSPIVDINISERGRYGFIITGDGDAAQLHSISFLTGEILSSADLKLRIDDITWNDDESLVLIEYESGVKQLIERSGKKLALKRTYPETAVVGFARNGCLWKYENKEVTLERISDGAQSNNIAALTKLLGGAEIESITTHPAGDDVFFWGRSGLYRYNVASRKAETLLKTPIAWLSADNTGKWIATSAGIIELASNNVFPIPPAIADVSLNWIGLTNLVLTSDHSTIIDIDKLTGVNPASAIQTIHDTSTLGYIGSNIGLHPTKPLLMTSNDDVTHLFTLSSSMNHQTREISVFSGNDTASWCWRAPEGTVQGIGIVCQSVKSKDGIPLTVPKQDLTIAQNLKTELDTAPIPAKVYAQVEFDNRVHINITTVPANAMIVFAADKGGLPKELVSENGLFNAPFTATIDRVSDNIGVAVIAAGYETRALGMTANRADVNMRIPLLDSGAKDIAVKAYSVKNPDSLTNVVLSDDTEIELRSIIQTYRENIGKCIKPLHTHAFAMTIGADNTIRALSTADAEVDACLTPIVAEIQNSRTAGALPELKSMADIRIDVTVP